jgi:hypothetical protein
MNAQISREWSSLKIILNLLLMILCSSLPCLAIENTANSSLSSISSSTMILNNNKNNNNNNNYNNYNNLLVHSSGHRLAKLKQQEQNIMMNLLHFNNNKYNNNKYEKESRLRRIDALTNMMMMRKRRLNYHRELKRNYYIEDRKYHRIDRGKLLSSKNSYNNHKNYNNNVSSTSTAIAAVHSSTSIINNKNNNNNNNNNNYNKINIKNDDEMSDDYEDEFLPLVNNSDNIRYRRESHHSRQPILRFLPVNRNNPNRQKRKKYCSARDPKTLAFEAPTVFEGKIKSMTSDRQANFSATLEIIKVYKQQNGFALPRQVRLQFAYKNSSECDIYREEFRHRGFVRDELDQGKIYFLFVKQISLGNFTILGQPIRKLNRTLNEVLKGVNEKYGKKKL